MSKSNNVNPDHYKTAGRERPGDGIPHQVVKQEVKRGTRATAPKGQGKAARKR